MKIDARITILVGETTTIKIRDKEAEVAP